MFSGDCYHTEIKIYLKQRKKPGKIYNKILQTKYLLYTVFIQK